MGSRLDFVSRALGGSSSHFTQSRDQKPAEKPNRFLEGPNPENDYRLVFCQIRAKLK